MKRIIVEGMDGSGKSRLVEQLWGKFFELTPVVNSRHLRGEKLIEWWQSEMEPHRAVRVPIHDRFFYSELVYGPVLRGEVQIPFGLETQIRNSLRRDAFLIFARPFTEDMHRGMKNSPQMDGVAENFPNLVEKYDEVIMREADHYGRRYYVYNWRDRNEPERVMETVRSYLSGDLL